jgi:hypothetical protein
MNIHTVIPMGTVTTNPAITTVLNFLKKRLQADLTIGFSTLILLCHSASSYRFRDCINIIAAVFLFGNGKRNKALIESTSGGSTL